MPAAPAQQAGIGQHLQMVADREPRESEGRHQPSSAWSTMYTVLADVARRRAAGPHLLRSLEQERSGAAATAG